MTLSRQLASLLGRTLIVTGLFLPATGRAETLVTHYFEGDVYYSTSELVAVGDRLTGTLTYDLDWDDLSPDNPVSFYYFFPPGWALEPYPVGSPIGMSFMVGLLAHRAQEYVELVIDDDPDYGDSLFFSSDVLVGPSGPCCIGGYLELLDSTGTAFSSDRPPARLDLSAFDQVTFWGTDGQRDFLATIDVLRPIPEPTTLGLSLAALAACGALRLGRRIRRLRPTSARMIVTAALLAPLLATPAGAVQVQIQPIALSGQSTPDNSGTFFDFRGSGTLNSIVALNDSGQVAFSARELAQCGQIACLNSLGIFLGDSQALTQIVRAGWPKPGGGTFGLPGPGVLNSAGQVAFFGGGLFRGDGGPLTRINGSLPLSSNRAQIGAAGDVAFATGSLPGGGAGIFVGDGTRLTEVVRSGQPAPDGNGTFADTIELLFFSMSDSGHVAFRADLTGTSGGESDNRGIFVYEAGTLSQVARKGDPVPLAGGILAGFPLEPFTFLPQVNNVGKVAFVADVAVENETFSVLFRSDDGALTQIARSGQPAPDGNGTFATSFGSAFFAPGFGRQGGLLNDAGQMLFEAILRDDATGEFLPGGLFLGDGGSLTQVVRMGQPTPDGNGNFSTLQGQLNHAGQVLLTAQLSDTSQGTADNMALYLYDDGELTKIVRTGELFEVGPGDVRTIQTIDINNAPLLPLPLNNQGQAAFPLAFTDGTFGIFLATTSATLFGDYNGNGLVEQADLDLVLLNWGADATGPPVGWLNNLPSGLIDQDELDGVLLNWGSSLGATARAAAVPEAPSLILLLATLAAMWTVGHPSSARRRSGTDPASNRHKVFS